MGKVKGTLLGAVVEGIKGYRNLYRAETPEHLHKYLDRRVLAGSWYEEEDYLAMMEVYARLIEGPATPPERRPKPGEDVFEFIGRLGAQRFFHSVPFKPDSNSPNQALYRSLVCKNDPAGSLKNYDTFWTLRHDTGRVQVEIEGSGGAKIEIASYALRSSDYCRVIKGSLWGFLAYSGARSILVTKTLCRAYGDEVCQWQASWKDPVRRDDARSSRERRRERESTLGQRRTARDRNTARGIPARRSERLPGLGQK